MDRNRFCRQCTKVVFDISGMSQGEIDALFASNGRKLCGAFYHSRPPLGIETVSVRRYRLVSAWLKGAASAAALAMLMLQPPHLAAANPSFYTIECSDTLRTSHADSLMEATSFLLSAVILDQYGNNIPDDVQIHIRFQDGTTLQIVTNAGFFSVPLANSTQEGDSVEVKLDRQSFENYAGTRSYPSWERIVLASNAQNLEINLEVAYTHNRMTRGELRRR